MHTSVERFKDLSNRTRKNAGFLGVDGKRRFLAMSGHSVARMHIPISTAELPKNAIKLGVVLATFGSELEPGKLCP